MAGAASTAPGHGSARIRHETDSGCHLLYTGCEVQRGGVKAYETDVSGATTPRRKSRSRAAN